MGHRIGVQTELVREHLLEPVLAEVDRLEARPVPDDVAAGGPLARRGYLSRLAETSIFAAARELPQAVLGADPAELAAAEPAGRPDPDDPRALTWRVPGPGGHVRHYLAVAEARRAGVPEEEGKRAWLFGFFARCRDELAE